MSTGVYLPLAHLGPVPLDEVPSGHAHVFYAHDEKWAATEAVIRFQSVKRWHMIDTTRQQTLAEHSANVSLLAYYIAKTAPGMYFGTSQAAALCGILHDLPEVYTGDIPSHTKKQLAGIDELESSVIPKVYIEEWPSQLKKMVKMCDLADGIRFMRNHGIGTTAAHAKDGLAAQLINLSGQVATEWPEEVYRHVNSQITFYAYEFS